MTKPTTSTSDLPIAVIGAGPTGLVAAAHLLTKGERPLVLEAGSAVAANIRKWGHVLLFTPWKYLTDPVSRRFLEERGWSSPDPELLPTGAEFVQFFLRPLAEHPDLAPHIHVDRRVIAVSRQGLDKTKSVDRENTPFELLARTPTGSTARYLAKAVIDASGTYNTPNPMGSNGLPLDGEADLTAQVSHGLPDVLHRSRARYADRRSLVLGSGHSAFNTVVDLAELRRQAPQTEVVWAVRRKSMGHLFGEDGGDDLLPARNAVKARARDLVRSREVKLVTDFQADRLTNAEGRVAVEGSGDQVIDPVDQIIVNTGFRPDLEMLREVRLELHAILETPARLAPLVDPLAHNCGTVPAHGYEELRHPEENFFILGIKSYGRASTFLLMTGYEQIRSVVAALAGDLPAARDVQSMLPTSGICTPSGGRNSCCGVSLEPGEASSDASPVGATLRSRDVTSARSSTEESCRG